MKRTSEVAMYCPVCTKGKVIVAANQREAERIRLVRPQNADGPRASPSAGPVGHRSAWNFKGRNPKQRRSP